MDSNLLKLVSSIINHESISGKNITKFGLFNPDGNYNNIDSEILKGKCKKIKIFYDVSETLNINSNDMCDVIIDTISESNICIRKYFNNKTLVFGDITFTYGNNINKQNKLIRMLLNYYGLFVQKFFQKEKSKIKKLSIYKGEN